MATENHREGLIHRLKVAIELWERELRTLNRMHEDGLLPTSVYDSQKVQLETELAAMQDTVEHLERGALNCGRPSSTWKGGLAVCGRLLIYSAHEAAP